MKLTNIAHQMLLLVSASLVISLTGNCKQYLGKAYTEEQINKLSAEEVDKLFSNYEARLSDQTAKSLCKSISKMYSRVAGTIFGITNQDALGEDLESNLLLNAALQRVACETYYRWRYFIAL